MFEGEFHGGLTAVHIELQEDVGQLNHIIDRGSQLALLPIS